MRRSSVVQTVGAQLDYCMLTDGSTNAVAVARQIDEIDSRMDRRSLVAVGSADQYIFLRRPSQSPSGLSVAVHETDQGFAKHCAVAVGQFIGGGAKF